MVIIKVRFLVTLKQKMSSKIENQNLLQNLFTEKQFSIIEILLIITLIAFLAFFYQLYDQVQDLGQNIKNLQLSQESLITSLEMKDIEIQQLKTIISQNNFSTTPNILNDIEHQNEMIKFWVKSGGIALGSIFCIFLITKLFNLNFSFKALIPGVYTFLQNNTPFFQEIEQYSFIDNENNLIWLAKIINNKNMNLLVKDVSDSDFIEATKYVSKLLKINQENSLKLKEILGNQIITSITDTSIKTGLDVSNLLISNSSQLTDAANVTAEISKILM